jgi:hypothetical protein
MKINWTKRGVDRIKVTYAPTKKRKIRRFDILGLPARVTRVWRRSLQFRTVVSSMALSGVAIILVGIYMSFSISNDLFASRLNQVLSESQRAQVAAQRIFDPLMPATLLRCSR